MADRVVTARVKSVRKTGHPNHPRSARFLRIREQVHAVAQPHQMYLALPTVLVVAQPHQEKCSPKPGAASRHAAPVLMALPLVVQVEELEVLLHDVVEPQVPLAVPFSSSAVEIETSEGAAAVISVLLLRLSGRSLLSASVGLRGDFFQGLGGGGLAQRSW